MSEASKTILKVPVIKTTTVKQKLFFMLTQSFEICDVIPFYFSFSRISNRKSTVRNAFSSS